MFSIYLHRNKINNKVYIGQTRQKPEYRWGKDGKGYKGQFFYKAILKYGWDNFEHIILYTCSDQEECNQKEIYYINKYNSTDLKYGYNIEKGGNTTIFKTGKNHHQSVKIVCLNNNQIFDNIAQAAEWANLPKYKNHIHDVCSGKRTYCGYHPKTKEPLKWIYFKDINNNIKKEEILNKSRKNDPKERKILCVTTGQVFDNIQKCIDWCGLKSKSGIVLVCQGKRNFAGKHPVTKEKLQWKYLKEKEEHNEG